MSVMHKKKTKSKLKYETYRSNATIKAAKVN